MKKVFYWGLACVMGLSLFCGCAPLAKDNLEDDNNTQENQTDDNNTQDNQTDDNNVQGNHSDKNDAQEIQAAGKLYSIGTAYELGFVTREDIMEICYHRFGEVWTGEDLDSDTWVKCNYTPTREIGEIDKAVEVDVKKAYYKQNEDKFFERDGSVIGGIDDLSVRYLGEYHQSYAVLVTCSLWGWGAVVNPTVLAGVAWWESGEGVGIYRAD